MQMTTSWRTRSIGLVADGCRSADFDRSGGGGGGVGNVIFYVLRFYRVSSSAVTYSLFSFRAGR